jgi:hypothetical protein
MTDKNKTQENKDENKENERNHVLKHIYHFIRINSALIF